MPPVTPVGVLIGRDSEITRLTGLLREVSKGRGSPVLIEGEPGIGKSALIRTVLAEAPDLGCQVFWGAGDELGVGQPALEAAEILLQLLQALGQPRAFLGDVDDAGKRDREGAALDRDGQRPLGRLGGFRDALDPGEALEQRLVPAERAAVDRAVAICEATGSPVYSVHLSSRAALRAARRGRERGLPVFVETRPVYLHLTSEALAEPDGDDMFPLPRLSDPADVARTVLRNR